MYLAPEKYIILGNGLSTPAVTKFSTKTVVFISFLLGVCTTQEETGYFPLCNGSPRMGDSRAFTVQSNVHLISVTL